YHADPLHEPSGTGQWVSAFDVEAFMPLDMFNERMARLRREIHAAPRATPTSRVMLPGELEAEAEADARENGVELEEIVWRPLVALAGELGRTDELDQALR